MSMKSTPLCFLRLSCRLASSHSYSIFILYRQSVGLSILLVYTEGAALSEATFHQTIAISFSRATRYSCGLSPLSEVTSIGV